MHTLKKVIIKILNHIQDLKKVRKNKLIEQARYVFPKYKNTHTYIKHTHCFLIN